MRRGVNVETGCRSTGQRSYGPGRGRSEDGRRSVFYARAHPAHPPVEPEQRVTGGTRNAVLAGVAIGVGVKLPPGPMGDPPEPVRSSAGENQVETGPPPCNASFRGLPPCCPTEGSMQTGKKRDIGSFCSSRKPVTLPRIWGWPSRNTADGEGPHRLYMDTSECFSIDIPSRLR